MFTNYKLFKESVNKNIDNFNNIKNKIINYVENNSYFTFYGENDNYELTFNTRENGSVYNEEPSEIDIDEAIRLKKYILQNFNDINVSIQTIDEWVKIYVSPKKEKTEVVKYIFIKDINGQGFKESFNTMDDLIKKRGSMVKVDWNKIKKEIETINNYPKKDFMDWYYSNEILIKSVNDKDNNWGYNFYIQKKRKFEEIY